MKLWRHFGGILAPFSAIFCHFLAQSATGATGGTGAILLEFAMRGSKPLIPLAFSPSAARSGRFLLPKRPWAKFGKGSAKAAGDACRLEGFGTGLACIAKGGRLASESDAFRREEEKG